MGVPGFVSKTYLSFYAVLLCEIMAALPRVTEDLLTLLLPFLAAGLKGDASKEFTSATLMVLTQLLTRAQLSQDFLKGETRVRCLVSVEFLRSGPGVWLALVAALGVCLVVCLAAVCACVLMPVMRKKAMSGGLLVAVDASVCIP